MISIPLITTLFASLGLGALLGLEREMRECPAGLRTHTLVCLGSTVFTLASVAFAGPSVDISRIAGQVVVGIGFIGGGVIFKEKSKVIGLTTAATLWMAAGIGILAGIQEFLLGLVVVIIAIFVLSGGYWVEKNIIHKGHPSCLKP